MLIPEVFGVKIVEVPGKIIEFSPAEIAKLKFHSSIAIQLTAYNYASQVIQSKSHVFELVIQTEFFIPVDTLK